MGKRGPCRVLESHSTLKRSFARQQEGGDFREPPLQVGSGVLAGSDAVDGSPVGAGQGGELSAGEVGQDGQDEVAEAGRAAVVVGGGDVCEGGEAGLDVVETVGFFADQADGGNGHVGAGEEPAGVPAAGVAGGAVEFVFGVGAVVAEDVGVGLTAGWSMGVVVGSVPGV